MATSEAQTEAKEAVFAAIATVAKQAERFSGTTHSEMVRDAAIAWRALTGGQQPGGIYVDTK